MRSARFGLLLSILLLNIPVWAQHSQTATTSPPAPSDPQAVAVVQAAITALGGKTAIAQAQSWTFQAKMEGPFGQESVSYSMSTDTDTGRVVRANGTSKRAPLTRSRFVPTLVGTILVNEFADPEYSVLYGGTSTVDSKAVTVIIFATGPSRLPLQIWVFDETNLPIRIDFRLPAEVGAKMSDNGVVALSDYRSVSGVLYPFRVVEFARARPPEIITLHSVNSSANTPPNAPNALGGDSR